MRMILLLVQLATCCAIAISCYQCNLGASYFTDWDWGTQCTSTLAPCPNAGDQCSVTKEKGTGAYKMECKADCKADANTKCCDSNGCNKWLDVSKDVPAWKKLEAIKAACDSSSLKNLKDCLEAISSPKTISCYQCDLGENYLTEWSNACSSKLTQCPNAGDQCSVTKGSGQVSYKVGCKAPCTDDDDTKCCNSDGCNNWLDVADTNQHSTVKSACNNNVKQCLDAIIKAKTISCYQCDLEEDYLTSWDWSAKCSPTTCNAGEQCSVTKVKGSGKVTYKMGCKDGCKEDDNTKCCNTDGCNNWLDVSKDADAWKKLEDIKDACSPSSKDLKGCLKAIDPTISGGGGLAGGLGLPLVLAISVIVLVVLG
ncbi:uncharacterized protein LOC129180073 isoform X2 [Dunckerocampus dactyliophorus]|uniref:uncharacterized protein LOC129180073 isoform X2 n=1 Tax=Dunckerocampus dactyliophorus TaxID=161453 RepID=UPI002406232C|nr:uncharacterized protein LOC129180073 isoform X2 [Dunckerocampus dactyliophorus]